MILDLQGDVFALAQIAKLAQANLPGRMPRYCQPADGFDCGKGGDNYVNCYWINLFTIVTAKPAE